MQHVSRYFHYMYNEDEDLDTRPRIKLMQGREDRRTPWMFYGY